MAPARAPRRALHRKGRSVASKRAVGRDRFATASPRSKLAPRAAPGSIPTLDPCTALILRRVAAQPGRDERVYANPHTATRSPSQPPEQVSNTGAVPSCPPGHGGSPRTRDTRRDACGTLRFATRRPPPPPPRPWRNMRALAVCSREPFSLAASPATQGRPQGVRGVTHCVRARAYMCARGAYRRSSRMAALACTLLPSA